jgi:AcrR family transcriptional regulator
MSEALSNKSPKSDSKAPTTREALLEAAIAELNLRPEADFRIETILASTGASFSSLYHHFGSREGLIIEAQIAIFKSPISKDVAPFAAGAALVANSDELMTLLKMAIASSSAAKNAKDRAAQLAILSAANSRPELAEAISKEQAEVTAKIAAAFDDLQTRGLIDPRVKTTLIGQFMQAAILGQTVLDAGAGPLQLAEWQDLLLTTLLALLSPVSDD